MSEVFDAALASGQRDYALVGAFDPSDHLHGYACYGATPGTEGTWDLYWFAVDPKAQRRGTGSALWQAVEREIRAHGGRRCIVETSGRADYGPARRFYERMGFTAAGRLADFYEEGDDRLTYVKRLDPQAVTPARPVAWQGQLHGSLISVEQLAERFGPERIEAAAVREAVEGFNLRITPEVLRLIRDPGDPVGRQYVPRPEEHAGRMLPRARPCCRD